jgi:hypothetical protein
MLNGPKILLGRLVVSNGYIKIIFRILPVMTIASFLTGVGKGPV